MEDRPAALRPEGRAGAAQGDRPPAPPTTASTSERSRSPGCRATRRPSGRRPSRCATSRTPTATASPTADDDAAFCARLLAEIEAVIQEEGPETIAMLSAEPIQNAGGCYTPPAGYWPGLRELADRYGFLLHADEVISGFGRLGEYYGVTRYDGAPDVITLAKGLTSGHVPMGAVMLSQRIVDVLREPGCTLMHGLTFGGHPVCAAVALKSIEIYEREGVLERVREPDAVPGRAHGGPARDPGRRRRARRRLLLGGGDRGRRGGLAADRRREAALRRRGDAAAPAPSNGSSPARTAAATPSCRSPRSSPPTTRPSRRSWRASGARSRAWRPRWTSRRRAGVRA